MTQHVVLSNLRDTTCSGFWPIWLLATDLPNRPGMPIVSIVSDAFTLGTKPGRNGIFLGLVAWQLDWHRGSYCCFQFILF